MVGPCTVNRFFFFVNQTFASCVFDKTQTLTRSQMYSKCSGVGNNSERKEKIRKEKKRERKMEGKVSIQLKSQILYITCIIFLNNFNFHAVFFFNVLIK
jgi:magnesium-transporting ATPase (P-type)